MKKSLTCPSLLSPNFIFQPLLQILILLKFSDGDEPNLCRVNAKKSMPCADLTVRSLSKEAVTVQQNLI